MPRTTRASATAKPASGDVRWNNTVQSREDLVEAKRMALIRAAGTAFKERGFHNTSLDEVAAALHVTKPTLYRYIDGKQDLLYRSHDYALDLGEAALEYGKEGTTGLAKLERMLSRYIELITDDFAAYSLLSDLNDMSPAQKAAIQKRRRGFDTVFRGFVYEGIGDGSIRECDPMLATAWFMGAVNTIPRWYDAKGRLSGPDVAVAFIDFITEGLAARRTTPAKGKPARPK